MDNQEKVYDVNIENTNIIPIPEESRRILNQKLIQEDPLIPYKKTRNIKIILLVIGFIILVASITTVIYKMGIIKWTN